MKHLLGNLVNGSPFGIHQNISFCINRFPLREQPLDFRQRISVLQQRPVRLASHSLPDRFRTRPQANDERMLLEQGEISRIGPQASSCGDDGLPLTHEFRDYLSLAFAKSAFSLFGEDRADWPLQS